MRDEEPSLSIEWGFAAMPLRGEAVSGDSYIIKQFPNGILMAVVDGLGHGYEAAEASKIAIATLDTYIHEPIIPLVRRCHEALRGTRGAVMSIASFNSLDKTMSWLGVGNIEGILLRENANTVISRKSLMLRGGVVGYQLPPLKESVIPVMHGDTLVFVTDGIRSGFDKGINLSDTPQQIADCIMAQFARGTDDALVLVVRYTCK